MTDAALKKMILPKELEEISRNKSEHIIIPETREELFGLAMGDSGKNVHNKVYDIEYDIPGKGTVREATVTRCKNGLVLNYDDTYIRRRDPNCMVIADNLPTDKQTHKERFGKEFDSIRNATFEWLTAQDKLIFIPFMAGNERLGLGYPSILVVPANAAVFALALTDLQGFIPASEVPENFEPKAVVYVAPPFRHTHYEGKQVVVHNRSSVHEVFSFNLYPGPSAKKGIYAVLLDIGEKEQWLVAHAATVCVVTPYELSLVIMHEGASGSGKSEMLETLHRRPDGRLLLGTNVVTGDETFVSLADACVLYPVSDDMAFCHPSLQNQSGKLVVADAENGWFLRVDHITGYGIDPDLEESTIQPKEPLVFLNMDAVPGSTCLLWEPIMDAPDNPCPNPRVLMPRRFVENQLDEAVEVDVRSFGFRQPPSTRNNPTYGIMGMFHILPPALAWLWRLATPRGFANPSIISSGIMESEGVGSYWPFTTGKMVAQANLLLEQIVKTPNTKHILISNQHIGAYKTIFAGEHLTRDYLARRGGVTYKNSDLQASRCPLLGFVPEKIKVDGQHIPQYFFHTNLQPELGDEAYDQGAAMLTEFFKKELRKYLTPDLMPLGREIIEACLTDSAAQDYWRFI